jgi:hypothetical protein
MAESSGSAPAGQATIAGSEVPDAAVAEVRNPDLAELPDVEVAEVPAAEAAESPDAEIPEVAALAEGPVSLECPIADKIFCEVLNVTDPYRRANQERNLGLAVDPLEGGNPLLGGGDLGFDVSLPSYPAYLTVSFFMEDGTVRHVLSGWDRRWPPNAREFVTDVGLSGEGGGSVEMVVALASDVPVFPSARPPAEAAERYLQDLRRRLVEISNGGAPAQIAASLLIVTPA